MQLRQILIGWLVALALTAPNWIAARPYFAP